MNTDRAAGNMGLNEIFKKGVKRSIEVLSFFFSLALMQKIRTTGRYSLRFCLFAFFAAHGRISIPLFKNIVNPSSVTGNRMTRQFEQFNGVTIETLNDCPHRLFSGDDNFIFQFCASHLVRFRGTVIKCLTDFVKLDGQSSHTFDSNDFATQHSYFTFG